MLVASPNSPEVVKAKADVVFDGPVVDEQLQAAADQSQADRDELVLGAGKYNVAKTITAKCAVHCQGEVRLAWSGDTEGEWMLALEGTSGELRSPSLSGLDFDGRNKAKGLLVRDVHRAVIENVQCYRTKGGGVRIEKGWFVHLRNLGVVYGGTPAFEAASFNSSTLNGLTTLDLKGDGPVVDVSGHGDLQQLNIEGCDTGDSPTVRLTNFAAGRLSGLWTERNIAPTMVHVIRTFGAEVGRLRGWQQGTQPMPVVVLVERSEAVSIGSIRCANVSDAVVRFDAESGEKNCSADPRKIKLRNQGWGVEPKHIVDFAGRGRANQNEEDQQPNSLNR